MLKIPVHVAKLYDRLDSDTIKLTLFSMMPAGRVVRTRNQSEVVRILQDNQHFGKLLQSRPVAGLGIFQAFLGEGLASVDDGPTYKALRRIMNPAFRKITTDGMVKDFAVVGENMVELIKGSGGGVVDMQKIAMAATVDSIGLLHFQTDLKQLAMLGGFTDPANNLKDVAQVMSSITKEGQMLILPGFMGLPVQILPGYKKYLGAIDDLDLLVKHVIDKRTKLGFHESDTDVLGEILQVYEKPGYEWLTFELVRDQLVTLFFAGSDTTASTVAWTLYELAKEENAGLQREIQKEVDAMLAQRGAGGELEANDLSAIPLLQGAIQETLRLYPPAPIIGRDCIEETEVDGYTVPPGTVVITDLYALHRDAKIWPEPDRWLPAERWTKDATEEYKGNSDAWIPFATGQRACIGKYFAMRESQVLLSLLLHNFTFDAGPDPELAHAITITSLNGINLNVRERT